MFRIVLFEPEIPPNTGNIIRLCANSGAELHLVRPLGFDLDRRSLRRAGLDYAWMARVHLHANLDACLLALDAAPAALYAIETGGTRRYDEIPWRPGDIMLFGSERRGIPEPVLQRLGPDAVARVPMRAGNRSLNLSNTVALVLYEAWRQNAFHIPEEPAT